MFEITKQFINDSGNECLAIHIKHDLKRDQWKDRFLLFNSETATYKYNKRKDEKTMKLETAPQPTPFLKGDYFEGLCEIAAACQTKTPLYIPDKTLGIFQSLFYKRMYARALDKSGAYIVGNFNVKNRYLFNDDGTHKEENIEAFAKRVKELEANKDYKVFSTTEVKNETLEDILN